MTRYTRLAATALLDTPASVRDQRISDGYFMSGRITYRPEARGRIEITTDRSLDAHLYAIYRTPPGVDAESFHDRLLGRMDALWQDARGEHPVSIDDLVTPLSGLAEGFVSAAAEGSDRPFFAAVLIQDGEMAAVTQGPVTAYLYREDAFLPLTADTLDWEPVDAFANPREDYTSYRGGSKGHLHYSNIVTLHRDDVVLLAPQGIMGDLGQRGMIRLFDEAEDQEEAVLMMRDRIHAQDSARALLAFFVEDINERTRRHRLFRREGKERAVRRSDRTPRTGSGTTKETPAASAATPLPTRDDYKRPPSGPETKVPPKEAKPAETPPERRFEKPRETPPEPTQDTAQTATSGTASDTIHETEATPPATPAAKVSAPATPATPRPSSDRDDTTPKREPVHESPKKPRSRTAPARLKRETADSEKRGGLPRKESPEDRGAHKLPTEPATDRAPETAEHTADAAPVAGDDAVTPARQAAPSRSEDADRPLRRDLLVPIILIVLLVILIIVLVYRLLRETGVLGIPDGIEQLARSTVRRVLAGRMPGR